MKIDNQNGYRKFLYFLFYIFNFYYFYRYMFQYNSETTSPTYSNTPTPIKILKYLISIVAILIIILYIVKKNKKIEIGLIELLLLSFCTIVIPKLFLDNSFISSFQFIIFILPAYGVIFIDNINIIKLKKAFKNVLIYHIIYSFVQFYLFKTQGRLTALGYKNSLVRFGGGWDDPNGFALFLIIPICYLICNCLENKVKIKDLVILSICVFLEITTFSFAGYISFLICVILIIFRYNSNVKLWASLSFFIIAGLLALYQYKNLIQMFFEMKSRSASTHFDQMIVEVNNSISFLFGSKIYIKRESFYSLLLESYGVFSLIIFLFIEIYFIYISYFNLRNNQYNIHFFVAYVFIVIYSIVQLGIPYFSLFPMNYIYLIIAFLSLNEYRKNRRISNEKIIDCC